MTDGCSNIASRLKKTRCQACYRRFRNNGIFDRKSPKPALSHEVIVELSELDELSGCRTWTGRTDKDGYPRYYDGARYASQLEPLVYVRRWLMEQEGATLAIGVIIEDICGNILCVSSEHLKAATVTTARNTNAAKNARKTTCVNGHPFNDENTYTTPDGRRKCRRCTADAQRNYVQRGKVPLPQDPKVTPMPRRRATNTHCANGHEWTDDNLYIAPRTGTWLCRQCSWESKMRSRGIDPTTIQRRVQWKNADRCRNGHVYSEVGFYDTPEGRSCRKCTSVSSVKSNLRRYYNLTLDDVKCMLSQQGNRCGACNLEFEDYDLGETETRMGTLNVDHCHTTGRVRGLLCMSCNLALGMVNDDIDVLRNMIDYLERHIEPEDKPL